MIDASLPTSALLRAAFTAAQAPPTTITNPRTMIFRIIAGGIGLVLYIWLRRRSKKRPEPRQKFSLGLDQAGARARRNKRRRRARWMEEAARAKQPSESGDSAPPASKRDEPPQD